MLDTGFFDHSPERSRRFSATSARLTFNLGAVVVAVQGVHLYLFRMVAEHARAAVERLAGHAPAVDEGAILQQFDRLSSELLFAATGPYLLRGFGPSLNHQPAKAAKKSCVDGMRVGLFAGADNATNRQIGSGRATQQNSPKSNGA